MKILTTLMLLLVFVGTAGAVDRDALIVRLNQIMDDTDDKKMSAVNKILFLNDVGRQYGSRGAYLKRDTVLMVADQELYTLNTDFAGTIYSAYMKSAQERRVLPVKSREDVNFEPNVEYGTVQYIYYEIDYSGADSLAQLGVHNLPTDADTIILQYFAYPADMSSGTDEWQLPDYYESSALFETASQCLSRLPTAQALEQANRHAQTAELLFNRVHIRRDPPRVSGETP